MAAAWQLLACASAGTQAPVWMSASIWRGTAAVTAAVAVVVAPAVKPANGIVTSLLPVATKTISSPLKLPPAAQLPTSPQLSPNDTCELNLTLVVGSP